VEHCEGRLELISWEETPFDSTCEEVGVSTVSTSLGLDRVAADVAVEWIVTRQPGSSARLTGLQLLYGRLGAVRGSLIMESRGILTNAAATWHSTVVAGSGTAGFADIEGSGDFSLCRERGQGESKFSLDYRLAADSELADLPWNVSTTERLRLIEEMRRDIAAGGRNARRTKSPWN
jgi:hypothetical protein